MKRDDFTPAAGAPRCVHCHRPQGLPHATSCIFRFLPRGNVWCSITRLAPADDLFENQKSLASGTNVYPNVMPSDRPRRLRYVGAMLWFIGSMEINWLVVSNYRICKKFELVAQFEQSVYRYWATEFVHWDLPQCTLQRLQLSEIELRIPAMNCLWLATEYLADQFNAVHRRFAYGKVSGKSIPASSRGLPLADMICAGDRRDRTDSLHPRSTLFGPKRRDAEHFHKCQDANHDRQRNDDAASNFVDLVAAHANSFDYRKGIVA